jgi:hypothetical protein
MGVVLFVLILAAIGFASLRRDRREHERQPKS